MALKFQGGKAVDRDQRTQERKSWRAKQRGRAQNALNDVSAMMGIQDLRQSNMENNSEERILNEVHKLLTELVHQLGQDRALGDPIQ